MSHKYTIEFDEDTWKNLVEHAGRGNIKDYIIHLLDREFAAGRIRAVILCGGEAADLYPTRIPIPKAMLPVNYRPVLEYLLEHLIHHGISRVTLVTGRKGNVRDHFTPLSTPGLEIDVVSEASPLGTGGALRGIRHKVRGTFLVANGDILTNVDFSAMIRAHRASGAAVTMLVTHPDHTQQHDPRRLGHVRLDGDKVLALDEPDQGADLTSEPPRPERPVHYNAGVYLFEPSVLDHIPADGRSSLETDVLPRLIAADKVRAWVMDASEYWLDVADPREFTRAWEDLLSGKFPALG